MRVLFVNRMASILRGGGETFDLEMARNLEQEGCEITFLTGRPLTGSVRSPIESFAAHTIRSPYAGGINWDRWRGGWRIRQADFWWFEKQAARWAMRERSRFDVIQVCELPRFVADWKKNKTGIPVVMRMTSPLYHDPVDGIGQADALIASGTTIGVFRDGIREDCIDIPNGVDLDRFQPGPSTFREQHGIGAWETVVLFVARLIPVKNHAMLIDAFHRFLEQHPESRLVLVGDGMEREKILAKCRHLNILGNVLLLGEAPFEQVPEIYAAADIKAISSDYESFSFTALEAMATAMPLVVTETDWVPRLMGLGEGGIVVPKNDPEAFARALADLANHPERRKRMGERNRRTAESDYGWQASAVKLMDVYRRLT
ncbi:MAG: glycosyltransferase family 4 protein [Verrucomicrobiota bacterium]